MPLWRTKSSREAAQFQQVVKQKTVCLFMYMIFNQDAGEKSKKKKVLAIFSYHQGWRGWGTMVTHTFFKPFQDSSIKENYQTGTGSGRPKVSK